MKYFFLSLSFVLLNMVVRAQSPAETLATKIAQKMKDSLDLTDTQKSQVYTINMQLHNQKMSARQQYTQFDSLTIHIQRIENTRDSLYHTILLDEKYILYQQKKTNLVNNN